MIDVGYHMSNLWFAAQQKNWDLAAFEVDETRNRIRWTIRISPTRKKPDGEVVDIKAIFRRRRSRASSRHSRMRSPRRTWRPSFPRIRTMLEACYSCHKASGKPGTCGR